MSFPVKDYEVICGVCRKVHIVKTSFLSSSCFIQAVPDGPCYPVNSCGAHTPAEVRAAWLELYK